MARAPITPNRQRYYERWTYDVRILTAAFAVAAPAVALLVVVLIWRDLPDGVLVALACVGALLMRWCAARLLNRLLSPLSSLPNLLVALRVVYFRRGGARARRDDPI